MQDQSVKSKPESFVPRYRKEFILAGAAIVSTAILILAFTVLPKLMSTIISASPSVPEEFVDARVRAGDAANRITEITDAYEENLEKIREADRNGKYADGLYLILDEINKNEQVSLAATDLAEELNEMAKYTGAIQPEKAAEVAVNAVTTGAELVERLIGYNNKTRELLSVLQFRLQRRDEEETRIRINELIDEMNEDAKAINNLASEYRGLMVQFDGLTQ